MMLKTYKPEKSYEQMKNKTPRKWVKCSFISIFCGYKGTQLMPFKSEGFVLERKKCKSRLPSSVLCGMKVKWNTFFPELNRTVILLRWWSALQWREYCFCPALRMLIGLVSSIIAIDLLATLLINLAKVQGSAVLRDGAWDKRDYNRC